MNEPMARDVVLVRAIESADTERVIFSNEDRTHASRAAAELARWRAGERHEAPTAESFVAQRAGLLVEALPRRRPTIVRAVRAFDWPSWIGVALPLLAFALGALLEHISDRHHVNILAFPLLGIVIWNVAVYVLLLLRPVLRAGVNMRGPRRWLAARGQRSMRHLPTVETDSVGSFAAQWSALVAPLMAVRAARVLHLAATLFALGAVVGLYVRGLVLEYRAGWESTFLDAPAVHAILSFFLTPAAQLLGVAFPSVNEIAALRFTNGAASGTNAALWIHLYAVTVAAVVILPRLLLALVARWQERRRANRFTFDMSDPYFRRLAGSLAVGSARLRIVPYSFTVDETTLNGLRKLAVALLGDDAEVTLHPAVSFGAEDSVRQTMAGADSPAPLTLALFNLASTPENENHGAFLKALRGAPAAPRLAALIDESSYRRRIGEHAGADARLDERRSAWRYFCRALEVEAAFIDLSAPDLPATERDLEPVLAAPVATP
ncbi:MAG TPA: DUF2868 domain-containing protein [Burkholderiaceae bacterium]|nr:DUF2868 domain-containing protein [Burkholderiaceae bacterium]